MTSLRYGRSPASRSAAVDRVFRRARRSGGSERGFTMIEALLAVGLFVIIATSLATVLVSAINSNKLSRQKTVAQQAAMDQIEEIRRLPYDEVGTVSGNPPGTVPGTQNVTMSGLSLTIVTQITYVNDPTPTSYATSANYKRVVVTVRRASDSKQLTREATYVAPPARAPLGGLGNAIVNVQVVDYATNEPVVGATVQLGTGPSAPRTDTTDATGSVTFAALTPNPTSGSTAYYDLTASMSGYVTLADDVSPGAAAHVQVAPGQTLNTALRVYLPATINVRLNNSDGSLYTGTGTVTVSSERGSETFAYTGGALTIDTVDGELVVPGLQYTVSAKTSGGVDAVPITQYVPTNYPSDLTSTFALALPPLGTLNVYVTQGGSPASGASVSIVGGPGSISLAGTADSNGLVTFVIPAGTGYTVTGTSLGQTGVAEATVTQDTSTDLTLALPAPGTIVATVQWAGSPVSGAVVTLTGGPNGVNLSGTSNASGQVTFTNLVAGSGFTVSATKAGQSISQTSVSVSAGGTTNVPLDLPTGTLTATVKWNSVNVSGATVTLTGGPMGTNVSGTSNASGQVTFTNVPAGSGYTVTATKSGASAAVSATVNGGSTTNVTINMPIGTLVATVRWNGTAVSGATVTLTGGPMGTNVSGTSNASGQVTFTNVPAGTGYTVTATKSGETANVAATVTGGSTTNVTINLPTGTLVATVQWAGNNVSSASVTVTGGPMGINVSGTSNASGQVTFTNVPAGSGYTVTATKSGQSGNASATVPGGGTANVTVNLPTATLTVTVRNSTSNPVAGATVALTLGPMSVNVSGTSNASGVVTFTNVPVGTGYTIKAWNCSTSGSKSRTLTSQTVAAGGSSITAQFSSSTCPP